MLRPPELTDAKVVTNLAGDFEVARWLTRMPHPYRLEDAQAFLGDNLGNAGRVWLIEDRGGLVGCVGMVGEFGYWLGRAAWGRGYATEAGRAVLQAHFRDGPGTDVAASHFIGNHASRHVLDKLGFRETGQAFRFAKALDREVALVEMRLSRADWEAVAGS